MDHITPRRVWDKKFKVDIESMIPGRDGWGQPKRKAPGIMAFTDGSLDKGRTGVGILAAACSCPDCCCAVRTGRNRAVLL